MSDDKFKKIFQKKMKYYMDLNNKTQIDIINDLGFDKSTVSSWCNGTRLPRMDKVDMLARYFHINRSDLIEDNEPSENTLPVYYMNDKSKDAAQFLFENPEYQVLFDATRKVKPEDIEFVRQMIDRLTNN